MYPVPASDPGFVGPDGYTYGAVIVPADDAEGPGVLDLLGGIRFSGWVARARDGRIVVLADPGDGVVANGRRGVFEVAALLAAPVEGPVLAVRVRQDRQLALVAWRAGQEVARYCSDPSREAGADEDVLAEPVGAHHGRTIAQLWDRADAADPLVQLLTERLDTDSVFESERLGTVLRTLGLPDWVVAAGALPRAMPTGPPVRELTRLRAGRVGVRGRLIGALVRRVRRRRRPPPVIADPPRASGMDVESWMY